MNRYGDEGGRNMPPVYSSGNSIRKSLRLKNSDKAGNSDDSDRSKGSGLNTDSGSDGGSKNDADTDNNGDTDTDSSNENDKENNAEGCKSWLEVLPSKKGILLAVLLADVMTEGMTPTQMNILAAFIASVGSLIGYKAARNDLDTPGPF